MRLWEVNHPYYSSESNYYSNDQSFQFDSLDDFLAAWGDTDPELNLVFRWDWVNYGEDKGKDTFWVFFVQQRKGIYSACEVSVTGDDEPRAREWLKDRLPHLLALWEPLVSEEDDDD